MGDGPALARGFRVPKTSWKATRAEPVGCVGYVPTTAGFGKARGDVFFDFMTGELAAKSQHLPEVPQRASLRQQDNGETPFLRGERNGQVLDERPLRALEDAFHAMVERSRAEPAATLAERQDRLARLRAVVAGNEERFRQAISADFGHRSSVETTIAETLFLFSEIRHANKHLKGWMASQRVATALQFLPARNRLIPQPLGVVGIIAPWNYPLQLTLAPAIGAIAAGNRVMIKPSELTPHFSALLKEAVAEKFDAAEMVVTGIEDEVAKAFAGLPFDHLVFTGSTPVGRLVAEAAGRNLTPVTLELGGKSPAIVDASADLEEAAERIAYGKLLNAGQTCIAPDYVMVPEASLQAFAEKVRAPYAAHVRHRSQQQGLHLGDLRPALCATGEPGGGCRPARRKILQPAKADDPNWKARRKFPPTLVVGAHRRDDSHAGGDLLAPPTGGDGLSATAPRPIAFVNRHDRPLALYWFGKDARGARRGAYTHRRRAASPSTIACSISRRSTSRWAASAHQATAPITANGGFRTFSKLKPVFYRSEIQPARRSLSALWRQDRAAGEDDAIHVVATIIASAAKQSRILRGQKSGLLRRARNDEKKYNGGTTGD